MNDPTTVAREYATEDRFLARRLATWADLHGPLVEDEAIRAIAEFSPARVLDVGCGTGDVSARVRRNARADVVAIDRSPRMVDLTHALGLPALMGDIQALPFRAGALDCVLANRVLYHVPDLSVGVSEIARVLRSEGALVAVTYGIDHLAELWELVGESPIERSASTDINVVLL